MTKRWHEASTIARKLWISGFTLSTEYGRIRSACVDNGRPCYRSIREEVLQFELFNWAWEGMNGGWMSGNGCGGRRMGMDEEDEWGRISILGVGPLLVFLLYSYLSFLTNRLLTTHALPCIFSPLSVHTMMQFFLDKIGSWTLKLDPLEKKIEGMKIPSYKYFWLLLNALRFVNWGHSWDCTEWGVNKSNSLRIALNEVYVI